MDPDIAEFARTFETFLTTVNQAATAQRGDGLTKLGAEVAAFIQTDLAGVDPVTEQFPNHQVVDLDLALEQLLTTYGGRRIGIRGANRGHVDTFTDFLMHSHWDYDLGPVSYVRMPSGPSAERRVVSFGIGLAEVDGVPMAWMQRGMNRQYGREAYTLEILCADRDAVETFLGRMRDLMAEHSVLRGQVISFSPDDFDYHSPGAGLNFLARPDVRSDQVILADGVLDRITRHVVGVGEHRNRLRAAGQHLKRGVLLYGPPGTGKTHLVRHLLHATPGTTAVLLSGRTLGLLNQATKLARAAQPAIVVLEDCDLVAEERGGDTNAALFETLEAMDGLDGDADITFILTTNRPDLLERALVERPGRVDLAVHVEKPDLDGRRQLYALYAGALVGDGKITAAGLADAAERTEGVTASFAKELVRRCVIDAAGEEREPTDADLTAALDEMLSDAETLTRTLLGGEGDFPEPPDLLPPDVSTDLPPSVGPAAYRSELRLDFD